MAITHTFVCAIADDAGAAAAGEVVPSNWNADHAVTSLVIDSAGTGSMDVILNDTAGVTGTGGYDWKLLYSGGNALTNGPVGEPNYINDVWQMGLNIGSTVGARADNAKQLLAITMESKYYSGPSATSPWSELHFETVDTSGVNHRILSFAAAHDGSYIGGQIMSDVLNFLDSDGTQRVKFDFQAATSYIFLTEPTTFRWSDNNIVIHQQRNAADSAYLNLPYFGSDDRLRTGSAVFVGTTPTTGTYANSFFAVQPVSGVANERAVDIICPTITGGYDGAYISGSASGALQLYIYNNNNASASAKARLYLLARETNGDPQVTFAINGSTTVSAGIDNSDSDKFKISFNDNVDSSVALAIDTSLNSRFYGSLGIANATNGQACDIKTLTELLTIAAAATSTTTIQKPANSLILGVSVRVTTAVTCTSTFTVGDSGSAARFSTAAVSKAVNSTDKGTAAGCYYNATAEGIVITPDTVPSDATGRVRVTIHYIEMTPPTS